MRASWTYRRVAVCLLAALAALVPAVVVAAAPPPGFAPGQAGSPQPAAIQVTYPVTVAGIDFTPDSITIEEGDSIQWTNINGQHNVSSTVPGFRCANGCDGAGGNGDPALDPWTATVTFSTAGVYPYVCQVHAGIGMTGVVTVEEPTAVRLSQFSLGLGRWSLALAGFFALAVALLAWLSWRQLRVKGGRALPNTLP